MNEKKYRQVFLYKNDFTDFYSKQRQKVKDKIIWIFKLIEKVQQVPIEYLKHIEGTDGLYEIRVQSKVEIIFLEYSAFLTKEN